MFVKILRWVVAIAGVIESVAFAIVGVLLVFVLVNWIKTLRK